MQPTPAILTPTTAKVLNTPADNYSLFLIIWERAANSGMFLVWAENEQAAFTTYGYPTAFAKTTIVKVDPESMPVEAGVAQ